MKATFDFCVEIPLDENTEWPTPAPLAPATRFVEGRYGWAWVPIDRQPRCDNCGKPVYPSLLTEQFGVLWRHCPEYHFPGSKGYWSCFIKDRPNDQAQVNGSDKPERQS
jgi:hypothetical protein